MSFDPKNPTPQQIQMLAALSEAWATGNYPENQFNKSHSIKKKVFNDPDLNLWAVQQCLLGVRENDDQYRSYIDPNKPLFVRTTNRFSPLQDLPVKVLWFMLQTHIFKFTPDNHTRGYSVVKEEGWRKLGLWEQGSPHFRDAHLEQMEEAIARVATHQMIYFQRAGSLWEITLREDVHRDLIADPIVKVIADHFGVSQGGIPNFEPQTHEGCPNLVGVVKGRRQALTPCFYVDGDLDCQDYTSLCQQMRTLGCAGVAHVFVKGMEVIQSPNFMFHRVNKEGTSLVD